MKSISPLKDSDEGIRIQDDNTFENLEELLKYYKTNRLDPAFPTIGQGISLRMATKQKSERYGKCNSSSNNKNNNKLVMLIHHLDANVQYYS